MFLGPRKLQNVYWTDINDRSVKSQCLCTDRISPWFNHLITAKHYRYICWSHSTGNDTTGKYMVISIYIARSNSTRVEGCTTNIVSKALATVFRTNIIGEGNPWRDPMTKFTWLSPMKCTGPNAVLVGCGDDIPPYTINRTERVFNVMLLLMS